jgi:8-oxo-dGTP pyrophosphatase MutT (NUDIX family)
MIFGSRLEGATYTERPAAYAVVRGKGNTVAAVRGPSGMMFLPGGGSLPGECPEDTVVREVREELARGVRLVSKIGEATQFFYARSDDCYYQMLAVFFLAEFPDEPNGQGEYELLWLPLGEPTRAFFHESHAWAAHSLPFEPDASGSTCPRTKLVPHRPRARPLFPCRAIFLNFLAGLSPVPDSY